MDDAPSVDRALRNVSRGLDSLSRLLGAALGLLVAVLLWTLWRGALPHPWLANVAVLFSTLGAQAWTLARLHLQGRLRALDERLGPGAGLTLLASAQGGGEAGKIPFWAFDTRSYAWAPPCLLAAAAILFFQPRPDVGLIACLGSVITARNAWRLRRALRRGSP